MRYDLELAEVPVPFRVDHRYPFDRGLIEVRRYFWSRPVKRDLHGLSDQLVINLALTSRPEHMQLNRLEGGEPAADAGRLLVIIPKVPYHLSSPEGSVWSLHCAVGIARLEELAGAPIDWLALGPFSVESRPGLGIETQLMRIYDELINKRLGRERVIEACVDLVCVELVRQFRQGRPVRPDVYRGGLAAWRMRVLLGRVHAERPAPRVAELAELCGLTERQLSRAFKAETGMTIGRFIDEAIMERAHRLLTATTLPIAAIARELGFASADGFSQFYRRISGMTPAQIRRR